MVYLIVMLAVVMVLGLKLLARPRVQQAPVLVIARRQRRMRRR